MTHLVFDDVLFARLQMAISLGFHIVFAAIGIAMPLMMVIAEVMWRRTGDDGYRHLARNWAKGTAVFFAVGAVSGTVLSFELGLLFPRFMQHAGPVIGMPFGLEGFAFFTEAIFLGIYLYAWDRIRPTMHLLSGSVVALSGAASAFFVLIANAWMNAPTGFRVVGDEFVDIQPFVAMQTPFAPHEIAHMLVAAYMSTGFAVAGIHAWALLRAPTSFHRKALRIALIFTIPFALLQPLVGHWSGQMVAKHQPAKLAAMEQLEKTQAHAPLQVGPVEIPGALSFIAFNDFDAVVTGLDAFPPDDRPPSFVHPAFQLMVALGTFMALVAFWALIRVIRKRRFGDSRLLLWSIVASAPMGFIALELGWVVTEVGRQPWVIYGVMRTADSVTPMPGLVIPFMTFTLIYLGLAVAVTMVLRAQIMATIRGDE